MRNSLLINNCSPHKPKLFRRRVGNIHIVHTFVNLML